MFEAKKIEEKMTVSTELRRLYKSTVKNMSRMGSEGNGKYTCSIPIELLAVDPAYQRIETRSDQKVKRLAMRWDERKLMPIIVVPHDEAACFAVVDGQGRLIASQMQRHPYENLDAIVLTKVPENFALRQRFEAEIFVGQDTEIEILKPLQKHKALCLLGDEAALIVEKMKEKYGFRLISVRGQRDKAVLGSYSEAYNIAKIHGEKCLDFIFGILRDASWNCKSNGYSTYIMRALKYIWETYPTHRKAMRRYASDFFRRLEPSTFTAKAQAAYTMREKRAACMMYTEDIICKGLRIQKEETEVNKVVGLGRF